MQAKTKRILANTAAAVIAATLATVIASLAGCLGGDVSPRLVSPETHVGATQDSSVEVNHGFKTWLDPVIRLFTRERNVSVSGNTAPVVIQGTEVWKLIAAAAGGALLLWLMPSGWPLRRRTRIQHIIYEFRGLHPNK